jgi:hypothetical protein
MNNFIEKIQTQTYILNKYIIFDWLYIINITYNFYIELCALVE